MKYTFALVACLCLLIGNTSIHAQTTDNQSEPPNQSSGSNSAQDDPVTLEDVLKAYKDLQKRVETLEKQHAEDQHRIDRYEKQGNQQAPTQTLPPTSAQSSSGQISQPTQPGGTPPANQSQAQGYKSAAGTRYSRNIPEEDTSGAAKILGQGNLYNPSITFFGDLGVSLSSNGSDKTSNRFNLREFELDARAAIAPFADGIFIGTYGEEISDNGSGGVSVGTVTDVEEGYIDFHSLPYDLTAKVGKFRNTFGVGNGLHTHDTPQVDRPLATQAFLGPEGISTTGASISWLVPNPGDQFIELTTEIVNADGGAESPILGGPNADNPAYLAHLKWFTDVGDYGSFELGGTYLYTRTSDQANFDANVFGLDATLKLPDPDAPDLRSFLLQGELYAAQNDIYDSVSGTGSRNDSIGAYAFAQWQFNKNWYAGVRGDYTQFPNSDIYGSNDSEWAVSPYVTWYPAEFLRLRLEYQHNEIDAGLASESNDKLMLQFTFVIGAHPPHPYWVNK